MSCSQVFSFFVDACLITGVLVSGLYLARHSSWTRTGAGGGSEDSEETVFLGAPTLTAEGHQVRQRGGSFGGTHKVSVELSYSETTPPVQFDGDTILKQLSQVIE